MLSGPPIGAEEALPECPLMSKFVMAIVQEADADVAAQALRSADYRFTIIPSRGGFLANANATFLLAVADDQVANVLAIFERSGRDREVELPLVLRERLVDWKARTVQYGGATVLVGDLEQIVRF
jgi:uncharacterized protein YaaQ